MRIFSANSTFDHPWDKVTYANWRKYPNEITTHVVAVDVLRREVVPETGVLRTERLITCKQTIPKWMLAVMGGNDMSYVREVSEVDPHSKTLTLRSQNLTMSSTLSVCETVTYKQDPANLGRTLFEQQATIRAFLGWQKLCHRVEEWCVERFQHNATLGRQAFENVLSRIGFESAHSHSA